ncbi:NAD-dependent epimerase/dehydratase family protein [Parabacteroides bouchesdurhonensis]|uniref:NAD-dependent epimerase/dehydratase family protein n=1 Tax=Parabacteroides bouchesdurhonensis TaxID=1936995 RepID=UPI000E52C0AE|nr:NAD-dependent epimerase/dehydratase family protein [Parabacteroides bouchesdurhonensis]RHJ93388.1 NAD-dependent epimerase/dehydratase family protein [Bacteroides sp. AM07-16]
MRTPFNELELDELIAQPSGQLVEFFKRMPGDLSILGANGKIGLSLCLMAKKAIEKAGVNKKVYAVSRFSDSAGRKKLEEWGIETIACDLSDREQLKKLPLTENVVFMAGRKFGTEGSEPQTWAMNVLMPSYCAEYYKDSRIVAFSTGCVYPLVSKQSGGSVETDHPDPVGEYAQSCLGRERVFEYFSQKNNTPVLLLRLNYSTDLRYGVLSDIGRKIWQDETVVSGVEYFNILWQGDANNYTLLALDHCTSPANYLNITGTEILSVKDVAEEMARIMGKKLELQIPSADTSYLNNSSKAFGYFGTPSVPAKELIRMQAEWIMQGGRELNKPTHFEVNNGKY